MKTDFGGDQTGPGLSALPAGPTSHVRTADATSDTAGLGKTDTDSLFQVEPSMDDEDSLWLGHAVSRLKAVEPAEISLRQWTRGETLSQRYVLGEELGSGGFGVVFRARDMTLGRSVAVKLLHPTYSNLDRYRNRFEREASAAAQIVDDHVVTVHTAERADDGTLFIVMELVEGQSLREPCGHERSAKEIVQILVQAAKGLSAAHRAGLIHCDIKCSNLLLDRAGRLKISDFGLARGLTSESAPVSLTEQLAGTLPYMSPEQISAPERLDQRSDVYGLGVVLYELLAGSRPFRGTPAALMQQIANTEPPPLRQLNPKCPLDLATIADKCLRKEPTRRYQTADDLAADLERWLDHKPITARPTGGFEKLYRWCRRKPSLAALTAALCFSLLTGTAVSVHFALTARRETATAIREANTAKAIDAFINDELLQTDTPNANPNLPIKAVLLRASVNLKTKFNDQPAVKAALHRTLGRSFYSLAMYADAESHLLSAIRIANESLGESHPDTIRAMFDLALLYQRAGDVNAASNWYSRAQMLADRTLGSSHELTMLLTAGRTSMQSGGNLAGRLSALAELCRQRLGADATLAVEALEQLARDRVTTELFLAQKQQRIEEVLRLLHSELSERSPAPSNAIQSVGELLVELGRFDKAEVLLTNVLERRRELMSNSHPLSLGTVRDLAELYQRWRRFDEATSYWEPYISTKAKLGDVNGLEYAVSQVAYCRLMSNSFPKAETDAKVIRKLTSGRDFAPWHKHYVEIMLGISLLGQQKLDEASIELEAGFGGLETSSAIRPDYQTHLDEVLPKIPALYRQFGKDTEAGLWEAKLASIRSRNQEPASEWHNSVDK